MAAITGNDIGLLFRIKADSDQATKELNKVESAIASTGTSFAGLANPAALAATAVAAIGTAAITATAAILKLTVEAAEFGSTIYDASQKTGLSAEAISSLKVAAEQSGSSLDAVTAGIARFAKNYTGTSQELQDELGKVFQQIANAKPGFEQLQLAQEKFGRGGAALIPIIQSFKGNLPGLIAEMKRLGLAMTDDAAAKADQFGDQLDTLKAQSSALGRQFVTELMPLLTSAMAQISVSMAANQGQAQKWGQVLVNVAQGIGVIYKAFEISVMASLNAVTLGFASMSNVVTAKSAIMTTAIYTLLGPLGMLAALGKMLGSATDGAQGQIVSTTNAIIDNLNATPSIKIPSISGGGGRGGGGGGGKAGPSAFELAQQSNARELALYKAKLGEEEALHKQALNQGFIDEAQYAERIAQLKTRAIGFELELNKQLVGIEGQTAQDKLDLQNKIAVGEKELAAARIELGNDVFIALKKISDKEIEDSKRRIAEQEELEKAALKRRQQRQEREWDASQKRKARREAIDPFGLGKQGTGKGRDGEGWTMTGADDFLTGLGSGLGLLQTQIPLLTQLGQTLADVFGQVANAVGQTVANFVLFGSAGTSFRKFAAQVIASVAQMAIVKAIFELAEGFAALATHRPTDAALHFKSAATYGAIGAIAAVAGRAVAGNAFKDQTSGGGAGGAGGNGATQQNNFTTRFNGFGNTISNESQQTRVVLAQLEETTNKLARRIEGIAPGDVVRLGAMDASRAIRGAYESELNDSARPTDALMRGTGLAR